jgi:F-type H+-transporting ATPase subunit b
MIDIHNLIIASAEVVKNAAQSAPEVAAEVAKEGSGGVIGTLGINWKLFLAQLVNFLIVLLIFWKWIVKPITDTLSARQKKIEEGLQNADYMTKEKENFEVWKTTEMKNVRVEAGQIIKDAQGMAVNVKNEAVAGAKQQAEKLIEQTKVSLEIEKQQVLSAAKSEIATMVVSATEKILQQKLDAQKDHHIITGALSNTEK